jgi:PmbA protein
MFDYSPDKLKELAQTALNEAKKLGATQAAVEISESHGLNVNVRKRKLETVEMNRDKGFGVTVHCGQRRGNASSADFSTRSIQEVVKAAFDIARYTAEDDCAGLPEPETLATKFRDFDLFKPWAIDAAKAAEIAIEAEEAAFDVAPQIKNSEGASVSSSHGQFILANSLGFMGGYPYSRHSIACSPIAQQGRAMQRDDWYSSEHDPKKLAKPAHIGRYAAQRALAKLSARKLKTGTVPVLFESPLACGLMGSFVQAISGGSLYRKSSFLLDSLGQQIFPKDISIYEDPFLLGESGSSSFDGEGVATQKRWIVKKGQVQGYFLGTYSARKLGMKTTGNSSGSHNLSLKSTRTQATDNLKAMIRKMGRGLFVTDLIGQGVNYVTGDYSRGANGFWVENGEIAFPVEEITIAGNLRDMYAQIVAVGSDEIRRGNKRSGSILIESMSLAGE